MADIFDTLGGVLEQQFSLGENKMRNLDIVKDGHISQYGRLGKFAEQFDQSAQRSYTEEGWYRTDLFNPHPKQLEVWMQAPDVTILVKKRAFSSLVENYRLDLMNKDEQLFVRATKFLFQNKCKQITAYERLTKIQMVATEIGAVDYHLLPALFSATDTLGSIIGPNSSSFNKFKGVIDRVRTIVNLSNDNKYTTWITNNLNSFRPTLGQGTGVIEFTTAFNINTTTSVNFGGGSCDISFLDPYNLMRITHNDIEQAIADATNVVMGSSFFNLSMDILNDGVDSDKNQLNKMRQARGANPIVFITNPDTFLGKRIRAIIDNRGLEIQFEGSILSCNIDTGYLQPDALATGSSLFSGSGEIADVDSLSNSEAKIFKRIIKSLYNSLQLTQNSRTISKNHNANTNVLRKKLRLHYGSKLIIQPMDIVNVFVSSKTQVDEKILGGLQSSFNQVGFLQTANKALMNIQDFFNAGKDNSIEKSLFVGKDFPNWLWLIMRNQFTSDKSGTQIFAGLVDRSTSSYDNNGTFNVNISCKDNASYFDFGVVNYKPALDVWNGSLYDPITPFDIQFDKATGFQKDTVPKLLQENQELFTSVFIKNKNGLYVGKKPNLDNYIQDTERVKNTSTRRVFYDPDGMVYKWKEGIGALVMFGNNYENNVGSNISIPPTTIEPFAGQDIMNTLSLLITGEPYNFATFYKAAAEFDSYARDVYGGDPSVSYFKNLQTDIKKRNLLYGNFVPFKRLSMDTETYKNVLNNQIRAEGFDRELNDLLLQRAELNDKISFLGSGELNPASADIQFKINNDLNPKINAKIKQINEELNKIDKPISLIGNDITLDYNSFSNDNDKNNISNNYRKNKDLRRRSHYLTRRLSWKVRANEDVNYFIVDDSYDKDYDIQAFEKSFENPSLFRSDYITVKDKINNIKELLDLEVFANTQGHIEIRPPQYNKVPSSVFYRMLRLKNEFDIQLYPQFLEDLYVSQVDNILERVEILEDEIRAYGLALGYNDDSSLASFLSSNKSIIKANPTSPSFSFLSDNSGQINRTALLDSVDNLNSDKAALKFGNGLNSLNSIQTQASINNIFSTSSRVDALKQLTSSFQTRNAGINSIISNINESTRQQQLNQRFQQRTGQNFDWTQLFPNSSKLSGQQVISQVDLLKILGEISTRLGERQRILKVASKSLQNAREGLSLVQNKNGAANKLLSPGLIDNKEIPQGLESIIEDESYDDYGPGSGSRYVLKNAHIKSMTIAESAPKYTAIEVQGKFGDNFIQNLPSDLNGFAGGGNALTSATAVDYDLWRMYGIRVPQAIPAPYLTDPQTQCAPFAVALLNKARKQIFSGNINIIGNEFMQPGEVVYVENDDMLFYVETVNHRISYGRDFSTSLTVGYGHMPGEYIPTYLDTVGKILYKNKDITNYVNVRQDNVNNEEHLGTIMGNIATSASLFTTSAATNIMTGTFAESNQQVLRSILQTAETVFSAADANYQPILELRIYYASKSGFPSASSNAGQIASAIYGFLTGTQNLFDLTKTEQPSKLLNNNKSYINIKTVDSDDLNEFRSPSSHAYSMARESLGTQSQSTSLLSRVGDFGSGIVNAAGNVGSALASPFTNNTTTKGVSAKQTATSQAIDRVIYNYMVDCWIYFKPITNGAK